MSLKLTLVALFALFAAASSFSLSMNTKQTGTVKFFDVAKGFGFITSDSGDDIFVHQTQIHAPGFRSLADGEQVEFVVEKDEAKGKTFATQVTGPGGEYVQGAPPQPRGGGGYYEDEY
ncbi:unnamed protein product [Heterosigma akashiwo]